MRYDDNCYAAMLLTMAITPDREEYARPYAIPELRKLEALMRETEDRCIGKLLKYDISAMMMKLGMSEEEGYRTYTLLHRDIQLVRLMDKLSREGIEPVTWYNAKEYPERLKRKLGRCAPPFFYQCGNADLLGRPAIGIVGIGGVKTSAEVREAVDALVRGAVDHDYTLVTGGEPGVSRLVSNLAMECGASVVDVVGGDMREHIHTDGIAELIVTGRSITVSLEHPDARFTVTHAIARNKVLFSMTDAAFIFNTDGRRGEIDILQNRYCDWVYVWEGYKDNLPLIARGAIPLRNARAIDFETMGRHWDSSNAEQLSLFELIDSDI